MQDLELRPGERVKGVRFKDDTFAVDLFDGRTIIVPLAWYPKVFEANLVVKYSRGLTKGEVKDRYAFFPYRLAGDCALKADQPDRAVQYLEKSPSSAALLDKAKKALAEKEKKPAIPLPAVLEKPAFTVAPFIEKRDFTGALEALRKERERGKDYDAKVKEK